MVIGRVAFASALIKSPPNAANARAQLRSIAAELVDHNGRVKKGYLRLSHTSGELRAGGFFTSGSRFNALSSIRQLVKAAYAQDLGPAATQRLEAALNTYFENSGNAFGTRSFVKLIKNLESRLPMDDGQSPQLPGPQDIRSRLNLDALAAEPTTREITHQQVAELAKSQNSPISEGALRQFQDLAVILQKTPDAFLAFKHLMFPKPSALSKADNVSAVNAPRTFAMGDADGSMGRMVLHAIASGVAELPKAQLRLLAKVMVKEAAAISRSELSAFQADPDIKACLDEIADSLKVLPHGQDGKPACIFLGDIISDRLTNNQPAMARLIYKLSGVDMQKPDQRFETGVRFIAGNHDTSPLLDLDGNEVWDVDHPYAYMWGANAAEKLPWKDYQTLLEHCFKAADYSGGVLTSHNGVVRGEREGVYLVAVGSSESRSDEKSATGAQVNSASRIVAKTPEELADLMNQKFLDRVRLGQFDDVISTKFRPEDKDMTPSAMGFDQVPGFRQLHGHNAETNELHAGVTNLNARQAGGFWPVSMAID